MWFLVDVVVHEFGRVIIRKMMCLNLKKHRKVWRTFSVFGVGLGVSNGKTIQNLFLAFCACVTVWRLGDLKIGFFFFFPLLDVFKKRFWMRMRSGKLI